MSLKDDMEESVTILDGRNPNQQNSKMAAKAAQMRDNMPEVWTYRWSCEDTSKRFPVYNPATGKILTTIQAGSTETATAAIEASHAAFEKSWRWTTRRERSKYLFLAARELQKYRNELAILLCLENGKPLQDAFRDVEFLLAVFRYFASIVDKMPSECFDSGDIMSNVIYEPHGVCIGILPFNWPPVHTGGKVAPCLAAGNTMILKPGEQAPMTVMRIVEILQTVFPTDVVQAIPGSIGPEVSLALIRHPITKMVSFTGSTAVGRKVALEAAPKLTATALELGGKNAMILFEDCDIALATRDAIDGAFFNKGEACTASSRLIVHESICAAVVDRLKPAVARLVTGDGLVETTHVGPLVSRERQQQVLKYIALGQEEGATLASQGTLDIKLLSEGFFVPPTLLTDVTSSMTVFREEIFGPVLTVTIFKTEEEAIELANGTEYGLFGAVYSGDFSRGMRVARKLDVGVCMVNNYQRAVMGTPFGGVKGSGTGREHWIGTLKEWSRIKTIRFPTGLGEIPAWRGATDVFEL